jgi:hypothetical protein
MFDVDDRTAMNLLAVGTFLGGAMRIPIGTIVMR